MHRFPGTGNIELWVYRFFFFLGSSSKECFAEKIALEAGEIFLRMLSCFPWNWAEFEPKTQKGFQIEGFVGGFRSQVMVGHVGGTCEVVPAGHASYFVVGVVSSGDDWVGEESIGFLILRYCRGKC